MPHRTLYVHVKNLLGNLILIIKLRQLFKTWEVSPGNTKIHEIAYDMDVTPVYHFVWSFLYDVILVN